MGRIKILPEIVASQVAAGEVVERPASIVKELVENSLDAQSRRVDVEFSQGGSGLIRVLDDGIGMDRDDALLCLERYATSKLRSGRDLEKISTFGFRGEALPSIASVSQFRLVTRPREAPSGVEVVVSGGRIEKVKESGEAYGTQVEVRSLFFNVPARRKFLRGVQTESGHILHQIQCVSLAHPEVKFLAVREGKTVFHLAATKEFSVRIRDLFGEEKLRRFLEGIPEEFGAIRIHGFVTQPGEGRTDRSEQYLFVNGRAVSSPAISIPLREAYHGRLPQGNYPGAILFVEMDPALVDCNVHPAKKEVRFCDPAAVRNAVREFVSRVLAAASPQPLLFSQHKPVQFAQEKCFAEGVSQHLEEKQKAYQEAYFATPEQMEMQGLLEPQGILVLGCLAARFGLLETARGMVIVDLRAARERIVFEQLLGEMHRGSPPSQRLLIPAVFELPPKDCAWVAENGALLAQAGLAAEAFGGTSVKVEAVPASVGEKDAREILIRIIEGIRILHGGQQSGVSASQRLVEEALARSVARLGGLSPLPLENSFIEELVCQLLACELPYSCPAGKPTMISLPRTELDRRFGRWS